MTMAHAAHGGRATAARLLPRWQGRAGWDTPLEGDTATSNRTWPRPPAWTRGVDSVAHGQAVSVQQDQLRSCELHQQGWFQPAHIQAQPGNVPIKLCDPSDGDTNGCAGGPRSLLFPLILGLTPEVGWHFPDLKLLGTLCWVCSVCGVAIRCGGI